MLVALIKLKYFKNF